MIYLDNAATTFPKPEEVYVKMDEANRNFAVNAGRGSYKLARSASELISDTKSKLRKLIHAEENTPVIFTPSITIALNQIINGLVLEENGYVYYSPYEHNAVARTLHYLEKNGAIKLRELPMDDETGEILIDNLGYLFSKEPPAVVFCNHVSNVTGYILPIKEIFKESKKYSAINVLDTAQSLGVIEIDVKTCKDIDILAFAGHKNLYGPFGIGGFLNLSNVLLKEFIVGGTGSDSLNLDMPRSKEGKFESASSNIIAIAGLNAALAVLDTKENYKHEKELSEYLIKELSKITGVKLYVPTNLENHIGIVSFSIDGYKSEDVGMILDEDFDIAVRTGYHCAPFIHEHLKDNVSLGTIRVGIGKFNTKLEINSLIDAVKDLML